MKTQLALDLERLGSRAYHRAERSEDVLRRYHALRSKSKSLLESQLGLLYEWLFVPLTLWPFNVQELLADCLGTLEKRRRLRPLQHLLIEQLPPPPDEGICASVAQHEFHVQNGTYEHLIKTPAKFAQNEIKIRKNPQLQSEWKRLKAAFKVQDYCDHKGVIRRTMTTERNLRPWVALNTHRRADVFQAAFDAFCLRWNLYGMQNDTPLVLKLAVNITPYGTMIHIPAYWSFDPKRDIRWDAVAKLHRTRVTGRQGSALAEGLAERMKLAEKLRCLDPEVARLKFKGEKKHAFLCAGLGLDLRTSPKRISSLRTEFKK